MINTTPVTVIGLGPMGQAMVRRLLAAGHPVTVWNRTGSRADDLVADGAERAATPRQALIAAELVILSLTDYQAMYDILEPATDALAGRTLINLSSDTPEQSRTAAAWAQRHGAHFLTGGVMVPAPMVGTPASYVYYSGDAEVLDRHRGALELLGVPRYLGTDTGLAQLMYLANLDVFLTTLSSLMHATALLGTAGMSAKDVLAELLPAAAGVADILNAGDDPGERIDADDHPGHLSTVTMMGATADHIVAASRAAEVDLGLPRAVQRHYRRAIEAGHGADNWTRIIDGIRNPI
jgi:3-hydroxyisobutyrate dehydrogenase-like beta-hydroxyacid dehydrogenase